MGIVGAGGSGGTRVVSSPGLDGRVVGDIARTFLVDGDVTAALGRLTGALVTHGPGGPAGRAAIHVHLGLLQICAGDLAVANRSLSTAHEHVDDLDRPSPHAALAHGGTGIVAALRGEIDLAETELDRAITEARALRSARLEAVVRLWRAEVTAARDPRRAHVDARFGSAQLDTIGDRELGRWAERTRAIAANASGEHRAAALIAERLLADASNPLDRGRTLIELARARRALDVSTAAAAAALREAIDLLDAAGARWFLLDALLLLAEAEPEHAGARLARARALTTNDAAHVQRWATRPALAVDVLGTQRLRIDDRPLEFKSTKTQKLLFCLALAGPRGREADTLAELLWPEAADRSSNLSTATWDARLGLGFEAWRLRRDGPRLVLDLTGARLDLDELASLAAAPPRPSAALAQRWAWRDAVAPLRRPVLPAWGSEEWVVEADARRATIAATVLTPGAT